LGRFLVRNFEPQTIDGISAAARATIEHARNWLSAAIANRERHCPISKPAWPQKLIGLGPGLTPSGDDFLGGVMIALHAVGETTVSDIIWHAIEADVSNAGNVISSAHVSAAAQGMGCDAIHKALSAILCGDVEHIRAAIVDIDGIGHTSGWDAMAGVVMTLDALISARS